MKKRFGALAISIILLVVFLIFMGDEAPNVEQGDASQNKNTVEKSGNSSRKDVSPLPVQLQKTGVQYMIILEQNRLYTYKIESGKKTLLRQSEVMPLLMSDRDVEKLCKGIYSDNLEEIYLYYESYAS
ncbi:MAG: hypothetical protein IJB70_09335 [Clostridia bacterium]|nr:hypothetical protein [Clostridia bacterium]